MSLTFAQRGPRQPPTPAQIQKMLDENGHLIQTIQEYQSKGKAQEVLQYQQVLHRNLVYLASMADASQNVHSLLPVSLKNGVACGSNHKGFKCWSYLLRMQSLDKTSTRFTCRAATNSDLAEYWPCS